MGFVSRVSSDRSGDPLLQLRLRRGADLSGGHLAALEDHQGRDRHHAIFRCRLRALVDVQLDDLDLVAHRAGNLVERGSDHAAGAAPFGPEIDHDRAGRLEYFGVEIGVRNLANGHWGTSFGLEGCGFQESPPGSCGKPMNAALPGQARSSLGIRLPVLRAAREYKSPSIEAFQSKVTLRGPAAGDKASSAPRGRARAGGRRSGV